MEVNPGQSPRRSIVRVAVDDLSRASRITNVLVRHGFSSLLRRNGGGASTGAEGAANDVDIRNDPQQAAVRIREALEELGPTFVKVGQILSTRADLIPPQIVKELQRLQDDAPPLPFSEVKTAIEQGLGCPVDEAYSFIDETPLASASMAQAHAAKLIDGTEVVIKVQRPGIAGTIRADLDLLRLFARFLEATIAEMELYAPGDIVRALDDAISDELDFLVEADNLQQMYERFEGDPDFLIPKLYPDYTTSTILTLARVRGRSVRDIEPGSPEGKKYALRIIEGGYRMIFEHGHFHGDPHPGNLFITDDGKLAYIDFGLCGTLSPSQQDQLITLIISVIAGDVDGIARILLRMGRPLGHIPMPAFKNEIATVRDRYLKRHISKIDATAFLQECMDAAQRYRIRTTAEYAVLAKSAATAEGIIRMIDPDFDIAAVGQGYARKMLAKRYSSERLLKEAITGTVSLGHFLREVPEQMNQILMDVETGRLQVRVENEGLNTLERSLNFQTTRVVLALCSVGCLIATPLFHADDPWYWGNTPMATLLCGIFGVNFAVWSLFWHLFGGPSRKLRISPFIRMITGRR